MKADFDGPQDAGDRPPSADGWLALVALVILVLILVAVGVLVLPRS